MLGGDYPFGPESERRRVYGSRITGKTAHFLTVLEPYESNSLIKSVLAMDADNLKIWLKDGRVQEIHIHDLEGDGVHATVEIIEKKNGLMLKGILWKINSLLFKDFTPAT